ncbi:MAG: RidA family protein [Anaerolineae bacterium]
MSREVVRAAESPPDLPFSPAIKANGFVFLSGNVGLDYKTGQVAEGIREQTRQTLENLKAVLEAAGSSLDRVVKVTVFLKNIEDFPAMNEVYRAYFPKDPPARSTVGVADLARPEFLLEVELIALA